jgi:hypothetical protein
MVFNHPDGNYRESNELTYDLLDICEFAGATVPGEYPERAKRTKFPAVL